MLKIYKINNIIFVNDTLCLPNMFYAKGKCMRYHYFKDVEYDHEKEDVIIESSKDIMMSSSYKINIDLNIFNKYNVIDIVAYSKRNFIQEFRNNTIELIIE